MPAKSKYQKTIRVLYHEKQSVCRSVGVSRSPEKPKLLLNFLAERHLLRPYFKIDSDFKPFWYNDFLIAHTKSYVKAVWYGTEPLASSSGLYPSAELIESTCYTGSSLYHSIKYAIARPEQVILSPVSGFHHAAPQAGEGFCVFSSQVIASVKVYRETGKRGAYLDLDGHYGNSIEDSRSFVKDLNEAVPPGFNFNPKGVHKRYISSFKYMLGILEKAILNERIAYVVFCHGADSHKDDDLGGQCSTAEWIECSQIFYNWVKGINTKRSTPLPVILTLFGGYRADDYGSVLSLHTADLVVCLNTLCGRHIAYTPEVKDRSL